MRVNIRQQMAHPMSEFLGTILIVVVLWFGGILVLDYGRILSIRSILANPFGIL
jgi:ATP-binding cassette, subfamily B, bacterial MsbA